MQLLARAFDPDRSRFPSRPWDRLLQVAASSFALTVVGLAVAASGSAHATLWRAAAAAAVHAGLLGAGWVAIDDRPQAWRRPLLLLTAVVLTASLLARLNPWGGAAYLVVPVVLIMQARHHPGGGMMGVAWPDPRAAALGLAAGLFLGVHLLIAASLTLGYSARIESVSEYLASVAYDVGLNAVSAEWFFRGAVFSWCWRRWAFAPAAALSSGGALLRYLLDPNLPGTPEARLGAAFYVGLLGIGACALRAWSGSLLPGYLTSVVFFFAYRALGH